MGKSKISPLIYAATLVAFLFPFFTVSCGGQRVSSFTGMQLAVGTTVDQPQLFGPAQQRRINPEPLALIAALCAVGGVILGFVRKRTALAAAVAGVVGAVSLLWMKSNIDEQILKQGQGLLQANSEIGYGLAVLLFIAGGAWNGYEFVRAEKKVHTGAPIPVLGPNALDSNANSPPVPRRFCGGCGTAIALNAQYCGACGRRLEVADPY